MEQMTLPPELIQAALRNLIAQDPFLRTLDDPIDIPLPVEAGHGRWTVDFGCSRGRKADGALDRLRKRAYESFTLGAIEPTNTGFLPNGDLFQMQRSRSGEGYGTPNFLCVEVLVLRDDGNVQHVVKNLRDATPHDAIDVIDVTTGGHLAYRIKPTQISDDHQNVVTTESGPGAFPRNVE